MADTDFPGYLQPALEPTPLSDDALTDFLQAVVVGITGLDGKYVRPRWQEEPPTIPPRSVNWAAVGVVETRPEKGTGVEMVQPGSGAVGAALLLRHEELDLLCSFYGPLSGGYAGKLQDGVFIAQNREELHRAGMGLVSVSDPRKAPVILKEQWLSRVDLTVTIRREIRRVYPVPNIASAAGTISTGDQTVTFDTANLQGDEQQ